MRTARSDTGPPRRAGYGQLPGLTSLHPGPPAVRPAVTLLADRRSWRSAPDERIESAAEMIRILLDHKRHEAQGCRADSSDDLPAAFGREVTPLDWKPVIPYPVGARTGGAGASSRRPVLLNGPDTWRHQPNFIQTEPSGSMKSGVATITPRRPSPRTQSVRLPYELAAPKRASAGTPRGGRKVRGSVTGQSAADPPRAAGGVSLGARALGAGVAAPEMMASLPPSRPSSARPQ